MQTRTCNRPVEAAVAIFGGKGKALVRWWLQERTWPFPELRR
jgi:DNA-binding HxlR family transcriptional regulator